MHGISLYKKGIFTAQTFETDGQSFALSLTYSSSQREAFLAIFVTAS
jgi:hypothetical protein